MYIPCTNRQFNATNNFHAKREHVSSRMYHVHESGAWTSVNSSTQFSISIRTVALPILCSTHMFLRSKCVRLFCFAFIFKKKMGTPPMPSPRRSRYKCNYLRKICGSRLECAHRKEKPAKELPISMRCISSVTHRLRLF